MASQFVIYIVLNVNVIFSRFNCGTINLRKEGMKETQVSDLAHSWKPIL